MTPGSGWLWLSWALAGPVEADEEGDYEEVIVIEHRGPAPRVEAAATVVEGDEAARVPGVQGDAVKAVQTLGGVSRPAPGGEGIGVWGTRAIDTRLYVDDVPVPRLFHMGGSRSILPSHAVSSVGLVPGGATARYGRALGGVVDVRTAAPRDARVGMGAHLDPIDVGTHGHYRMGDHGWLATSARRSVLSRLFDAVAPGGATPLVPVPDYWDYQVRGHTRLPDGQRLSVLTFGANDRVDRGIASLDPAVEFTEQTRGTFHRVAIRLARPLTAASTTDLLLWGGADRDVRVFDFGSVTASDDRTVALGGLLLTHEREPLAGMQVRVGIDAEARSTVTVREGAISLPAREGDVGVFGQAPGDRVNQDRWRVGQAAAAAFASVKLFSDTLQVEPGVRVEPSVTDGNRVIPVRPAEPPVGLSDLQLAMDPRLSVAWTPDRRVRLYLAAGRYHQPPVASDLSPVFGTPTLPSSSAWHGLAGVVAEPWSWFTAEAVGFWVDQRSVAVRAPLATPAVASLLVPDGEGRSRGAQLSVDGGGSGQLRVRGSYTLVRSERRPAAGAPWRLFDGDQTHGVQALIAWRPRGGFELASRFELASGTPRTPVVGAVFNTGTQAYDPLFGDQNTERLPTFWSLAAQVAWGRAFAWGEFRTYLDVQNVTNRRNAEEVFYTSDYRQQAFVQGLPILPVLGVEVQL